MPLVRVQRRWALVVAVIGMPRAVPTAAADSGQRVLGFAALAGMIPRHGGRRLVQRDGIATVLRQDALARVTDVVLALAEPTIWWYPTAATEAAMPVGSSQSRVERNCRRARAGPPGTNPWPFAGSAIARRPRRPDDRVEDAGADEDKGAPSASPPAPPSPLIVGREGGGRRAGPDALRQTRLPLEPGGRCIASVGAAGRPPAGADELFAAADRALYRAKQRGRERLVLGDDESAA
jgi:hypothetical protein